MARGSARREESAANSEEGGVKSEEWLTGARLQVGSARPDDQLSPCHAKPSGIIHSHPPPKGMKLSMGLLKKGRQVTSVNFVTAG
jgi:hypothetical protein